MIQVTCISRERIAMSSGVDTSPAQFLSFFICQVPSITLVKHTICECATGADRKEVAFEAGAV